jgi:hypothetical protein
MNIAFVPGPITGGNIKLQQKHISAIAITEYEAQANRGLVVQGGKACEFNIIMPFCFIL